MCGRFGLFAELDALAEQFNFDPLIMRDVYSPRWNIPPTTPVLSIHHSPQAGASGENDARLLRWGMTGARHPRARGSSRQPPNTLYCGRPTKRANPFPIGERYTREEALAAFRRAFWANELPLTPEGVRAELPAYEYLSCWCRLDQECHVDEYIRAIHCEHRLRDVDGRCCLVCRACLHRDIIVEGARASCGDCGKAFIGW